MFGMNTDTPALFVNIHTYVNGLTCEINFATFIHGKPPFGLFLFGETKYTMLH
jgi:hypothetical protein